MSEFESKLFVLEEGTQFSLNLTHLSTMVAIGLTTQAPFRQFL